MSERLVCVGCGREFTINAGWLRTSSVCEDCLMESLFSEHIEGAEIRVNNSIQLLESHTKHVRGFQHIFLVTILDQLQQSKTVLEMLKKEEKSKSWRM